MGKWITYELRSKNALAKKDKVKKICDKYSNTFFEKKYNTAGTYYKFGIARMSNDANEFDKEIRELFNKTQSYKCNVCDSCLVGQPCEA